MLATNETTTVRDFIRMSFKHAGIELEFEGEGIDEKGIDRASGKTRVEISPRYFRPTEVDLLLGDYAKAKAVFGWEPQTKVDELSRIMVEADVALAERERAISKL